MDDIRKMVVHELADTTASDVAGSAVAATALQPVEWLKQIVDAAQKRLFFTQAAKVFDLPKGTKDLVQPFRGNYLGGSGVTDTYSEGAAVSFTTINNLDGVTFTPADKSSGVAIGNRALRVNLVNLVEAGRNELTYAAGDVVDIAVRDAIEGATLAGAAARGAQTLFGGGKGRVEDIVTGDTITPELVADAKMRLMSKVQRYRDAGGAELVSSVEKPPWHNESDFLLFIAPEQENIFLKDPQFVNAASYGSNRPLLQGEIGDFLGIKVVVSNNVKRYAGAASDTTTGGTWGAQAGYSCYLIKAGVGVGLAYGQRPKLHIFDFPSELETRIVLEQAYEAKTIHDTAIVVIKVAEE